MRTFAMRLRAKPGGLPFRPGRSGIVDKLAHSQGCSKGLEPYFRLVKKRV